MLGTISDAADVKNSAALSKTEGGFRLGTLEMRYCRSCHATEGGFVVAGGYVGSQLNLTWMFPLEESYANRGRG